MAEGRAGRNSSIMLLITTADQRFWKTNESILFLGEWCKLFSQRSVWGKLSYEVLPYHWDDRQKYHQDYIYLDKLYEQKLSQVANILNRIHGVDHTLRYWRIVIGPWLFCFIQILYDRYQSILTAIDSGKEIYTLIGNISNTKWLPRDFSQFSDWFVTDDYNHYIYSRIIEFVGKIPFSIIEIDNKNNEKEQNRHSDHYFSLKKIIKNLLNLYGKFIPDCFNKIVLISSYLDISDLIKLQLSLKQIPYLFPLEVATPAVDMNPDEREKFIFKSSRNEFEQILNIMIKEQLPLIYVEGYSEMNRRSLEAYPKKPKMIFTANAYWINETFKFWAANHVDLGVDFVGTQHGGYHGIGLWSVPHDHQIRICTRFYTWGWGLNGYKNTKPLAATKLNKAKKCLRAKKDGRILLVLSSVPRYSYHMYCIPVSSSGMLSYLNDQYSFVRDLSINNQKSLLVRLYHLDYGWNQVERWNSEFPNIECYQGAKSMFDQLRESCLFIGTGNGTTYIETFAANFPTIVFWDSNLWEIKSTAQPYFDELRRVGIFHDTPKSAADMVNEISPDPAYWWKQTEIQRAKDKFCFRFARTSDNWLSEWREELS